MPPRPGLTAERIVDVAAELADRDGYAEVTLGKVATELGVRTPSLYNHVQGLDDLRRRMTARGLAALGDELARAAVGRSEDDAVQAIAGAYRRFARTRPGLYAATVPTTEGIDEEIQRAGEAVLRTVLAALAGYGLAEEDAIHATRTLRSAVHGFVDLEVHGGFGLGVDVDSTFSWLTELLAAGFAAAAGTGTDAER